MVSCVRSDRVTETHPSEEEIRRSQERDTEVMRKSMVLGHITESQERLMNRKAARETVGTQKFLRGIAPSEVQAGGLRRPGLSRA